MNIYFLKLSVYIIEQYLKYTDETEDTRLFTKFLQQFYYVTCYLMHKCQNYNAVMLLNVFKVNAFLTSSALYLL